MTPPLTLTKPTDDQINAAVAEHVAGLEIRYGEVMTIEPDKNGEPVIVDHRPIPSFTTSMDAVLPLLEQYGEVDMIRSGGKWQVVIHTPNPGKYFADGYAYSLPRAACLALLRAHGVGVVG